MLREVPRLVLHCVRALRDEIELAPAAKAERWLDRQGLPVEDPGPKRAVEEGIVWLKRAQSRSKTADGGIARDFSLISGWNDSYPETTGYIVPTMLTYGRRHFDQSATDSGRRMLDWLTSIQFPDGGFQGGLVTSTPFMPVTFNTGQILIGLAAGVREFGAYEEPMTKAADWLADTQDADGCWRRYPTPFAEPGEKSYETHVAWGLYEAARLVPKRRYAEAARRNVEWALTHQFANGWMSRCCLTDPTEPLTHTLGYALRGILEAYRFEEDERFLRGARKLANGLRGVLNEDGFLPGRLRRDWGSASDWACLTGTAQIAHCWLMLHEITGDTDYFDAGRRANRYVRRTIRVDGLGEHRGAVKGSFPVDGPYGQFQYLSWGTKFMIDANMLELEISTSAEMATRRRRVAG